jgi:hypothetical protein
MRTARPATNGRSERNTASHNPDSRCARVTEACGLVPSIDAVASAEERSLIEADGTVMRRSLVVPLGPEPLRHIGDDIPHDPGVQ